MDRYNHSAFNCTDLQESTSECWKDLTCMEEIMSNTADGLMIKLKDLDQGTLFLISLLVAQPHFGYLLFEHYKICMENRRRRGLLHIFIIGLHLLMVLIYEENMTNQKAKAVYQTENEEVLGLNVDQEPMSQLDILSVINFGILIRGLLFVFFIILAATILGLLEILATKLLDRYQMLDTISERFTMILLTCENICNQLCESIADSINSLLEIGETPLGLISYPLNLLWKKAEEVLANRVTRLSQLVLFLLLFGHHSILGSLLSLVYGTWDDYLSESEVGQRIEGVYEEYQAMTITKIRERYFKVPDGLHPDNTYIIRNLEVHGFNIVQFRIETRAVPDSNPVGVRCIRCFGELNLYGSWFPLPSALAG